MTDRQFVEMPIGAEVLSVGIDNLGYLCVWATVDPDAAKLEMRQFMIVGTGNEINADLLQWKFVGSAFMYPFIWHVFVYNS